MRKIIIVLALAAIASAAIVMATASHADGFVPNYKWRSEYIPASAWEIDASTASPVTWDTTDLCWLFPTTVKRHAYTSWQVPHEWDPRTVTIYPSVHWSPIGDATTDTSDAAVRLGFDIRAADINGSYPAATTYAVTATCEDGASDKHYETDIPAAGYSLGNAGLRRVLLIDFYRDATTDTGLDTNTDSICVHGASFTYRVHPKVWDATIDRNTRENWPY
jgi:hypothetical protein